MLACRSVIFFLIDRLRTSVFRSTTVYGYDIILIIIIIYKAHVEIRSFIQTLSFFHPTQPRHLAIHDRTTRTSQNAFLFQFLIKEFTVFFLVFVSISYFLYFSRLIAGIEQRKRITFLGSLTTTVEIKQLVLYK